MACKHSELYEKTPEYEDALNGCLHHHTIEAAFCKRKRGGFFMSYLIIGIIGLICLGVAPKKQANQQRSELRTYAEAPREDVLDVAESLIRYVRAEALRHKLDEPTLNQLLRKLDQAKDLIDSVDTSTAAIDRVKRVTKLRLEYGEEFHLVSGYIYALEFGKREREIIKGAA